MSTALANQPRSVELYESTVSDASARIDEEKGVIYGVKVLGFQSRATGRTIGLDERDFGPAVDQPYRYSREAVIEAAPLYEHCRVYLDHPEFSYRSDGERIASMRDRRVEEVFGELCNIRVTESGMYGDLQYVKAHPRAAQIIETARRFPHLLALSHNAKGDPVLENQQVVIQHISDVRSVDLVGERPGTTQGLFETARQNMADKLGTPEAPVVGKSDEQITSASHLGDASLHEDDPTMTPPDSAAPMMEDAPAGDPGAAPAAGDPFDAAFQNEVISIWNGEGDPKAKAKKIAELAKHQDGIKSLRSGGDSDGAADDLGADLDESDPEPQPEKKKDEDKPVAESDPEPPKPDDKKPTPESAPRVVQVTPNKGKLMAELLESIVVPCVDLLNSRGVPVRGATLSALCRTPSKRRLSLVESFADPALPAGRSTPRSQAGAVGLQETSPAAAKRPAAAAAKPQPAKPKLLEKSSDELFAMFGAGARR